MYNPSGVGATARWRRNYRGCRRRSESVRGRGGADRTGRSGSRL